MNDQFSTIKAEVKAAFEAYLTANGTVRDRARAHGEALLKLKAACAEHKLQFVETLKELGVVVSTAYQHLRLVAIWADAMEIARTRGVKFEALCISEVIELVKPTKKRKPVDTPVGGTHAQSSPTDDEVGQPALTNRTPDEVFAQVSPSNVSAAPLSPLSHPAQPITPMSPSALPSTIQNLIDRNLVRVIHAERGRSVEVEVGDSPVLVVAR